MKKAIDTYVLNDAEIALVCAVNGVREGVYESDVPKKVCWCALHGDDTKPSHCQQGPTPRTRMPDCGYWFDEVDGDLVRKGECKQCGRCCALPRKNGDPYGFYDPHGKHCKHLIVEE